jgi:poly(3-hydroxybutyrate) depolymerase
MKRVLPLLVLMIAPVLGGAQTIVKGTFLWKSVTRHYTVVVPPGSVPLSGELVITLHGLKYANSSTIPDNNYYGWDYTCKQKGTGCIVVAAVSTWDPDATSKNSPGYWAWNAGFFDNMVFSKKTAPYTTYPDDIGYLRQLIATVRAKYPVINAKKVYVVGFSVGAFMASRAAVELSDLVAAVAINSGSLQSTLGSTTVPSIPHPVSIAEYHGTLDNNTVGVDPCSAKWDWNQYLPEKSTVDSTYSFFSTQNKCKVQSTALPLCQTINGVKVYNNKTASSCATNGVVKFTWETGTAHQYLTTHNAADLSFFRAHAKP